MKYLASLYTLIIISGSFLLPQAAFADTSVDISSNGSNSHSEVNVQSNTGNNTICQNGTCTTTDGNDGQSTVCINGHCETSSGNIDMQSDNGNDQVHINNAISDTPVTISPSSTDVPTISPSPSISPVPTLTPDPTIAAMRHNVRKEIKKQIQEIKEHVKSQNAALSAFLQSQMQSIQDLLNGLFK
jgi:hypothetical protein